MPRTNAIALHAFRLAVQAINDLCADGFTRLDHASGSVALIARTDIEHSPVAQRSARFFQNFLPLREQMVVLLAESYRRYFKLALAHPSQTGGDPDLWAQTQLQPPLHAALEWIREWYILACDGENQSVRHVGSLDFVPGGTASLAIPTNVPPFPSPTSWRAPAWLFAISIALVGVGPLKQQHVPNTDSEERLGEAHTRLLLKGARRVFLWELGAVIERVRNEETAAAGAVRVDGFNVQKRAPNKRKGWQQREKLYSTIRKILSANPQLQGIAFCAELDKRQAAPLVDWIEGGEWRKGFTWKEAWQTEKLRRKIRRVRQEAQKMS
jgi:hypothetical protein